MTRVGSMDSKPRRQPFSQRAGESSSSSVSGTRPRYEIFQVRACIREASTASSMTPRRMRTSGMRVEPVRDAARVVDPVLRLAAAGELVRVVLVAHEDGFLAEHLQRDEELLGLLDRTAVILLGVEDEERRLHVREVGERRMRAELLRVAPRRRITHLVLPEVPADIARPERADVVADAPLRDRGLEALGVADDPVGHEPAVAAAGHVEPLRVDPTEAERVIDAGHEVLVVLAAPVADAGSDEPIAVGMAPAGVHEEHPVATTGEQLELVEEGVAVRAVRAAMDLENERPRA